MKKINVPCLLCGKIHEKIVATEDWAVEGERQFYVNGLISEICHDCKILLVIEEIRRRQDIEGNPKCFCTGCKGSCQQSNCNWRKFCDCKKVANTV